MTHELSNPSFHPTGEQPPVGGKGPPQGVILDSFAGPVHVEWDTEAALTPVGNAVLHMDKSTLEKRLNIFVRCRGGAGSGAGELTQCRRQNDAGRRAA